MFTLQAAKLLSDLSGRVPDKEWGRQLVDAIIGMAGQCNAELEHRGPVRIENTLPSTRDPGSPATEDSEPGLTVCTSNANNTLPGDPVAIYVECGDVVIDGNLIVNGDTNVNVSTTIFNECTTFNGKAIFNCGIVSTNPRYSHTIARICITDPSDLTGAAGGSAEATIISGSEGANPGDPPTWGTSGDPITVYDRTGRFLCAEEGWCGTAMFFSDDETTACDEECDEQGSGWWEILTLQPGDDYSACVIEVVTAVCCLNGRVTTCTRNIKFGSPVKEIAASECECP